MSKKLLITVTILLLLTGCGQLAESPPSAEPTPAEVTHESSVERAANFEETPCPFDGSKDTAVECGFVTVPEDHGDPTGPTIRIAVAVLKDQADGMQSGETHRPDPVMLLSGGPGEKTVHNTLAMAQVLAPIHPNRDLIIFDQRGVGLSEPAGERGVQSIGVQHDPERCRRERHPPRAGLRPGQPVRWVVWFAAGAGCDARLSGRNPQRGPHLGTATGEELLCGGFHNHGQRRHAPA